jgi:amidohydrolase
MSALFDSLRMSADNLQSELVALRRHIHQFPELSWEEVKTASKLQMMLADHGLQNGHQLAKTGFFIDIEGKEPGPVIAYRADLDALAINDAKRGPYASKVPGVGHMCGHDYHSTLAYGVALLLGRNRDKFNGTIRVFWQPAEESSPSGAPSMIEDGILNGVEAVYGIHCDPTIPSGTIAVRHGADTASFDAIKIEVRTDNTTHSARPHTGKDVMWIAHQMLMNLYQIPTRITDARSPLVISICTFHAGEALNIIPDQVRFGGTIRASGDTERYRVRQHIYQLATQTEELYGVKVEVDLLPGAPPVINNSALVDAVRSEMLEVLGPQSVLDREQSMGAEDFGYYSQIIPAVFLRVGTSCSPETSYPLHSKFFDVDETTLAPSSALLSYLLIRHLQRINQHQVSSSLLAYPG